MDEITFPPSSSVTASPGPAGRDRPAAGTCCADSAAAAWNMRRRRRLDELADIGLDLARMLRQQAQAAQWLGTEGPVMFERIARAVRQTTALEAKFEADHQARGHQGAVEQAMQAAGARRTSKPRKAQVQHLVEAAIKSDAAPRDAENLLRDLHERLDDPDIEAEFANRSTGEIVAGICRDLGITADLSLWSDDAQRDEPPDALAASQGAKADRPRLSCLRTERTRMGEALPLPPGVASAAGSNGPPSRPPWPPDITSGGDPPACG